MRPENGVTRSMEAAFGLAVVCVLAWIGGCSDDGHGIVDPAIAASDTAVVVVSDPVPNASPAHHSGRAGSAVSLAVGPAAAEMEVAYVSLPPGTVPNAVSAVIITARTVGTMTVPVTDGGFDPVPVAAGAGDIVAIEVRLAGGGSPVHLSRSVPARRPPRVVRTVPPRGKTDVAVNQSIVVVFSEPVAANTLTSSSVQLFRGTSLVQGAVRPLEAVTAGAVFQPAASLSPNTTYRLVVTQAVKDDAGDALETSVSYEFTTGTTVLGPVASVTVLPDSLRAGVGSQFQLVATPRDAKSNVVTGRPVLWSSTDPTVAAVSTTGVVTALAEGYTGIVAEVDGQRGGVAIVVSAALVPIGSVRVTPDSTRVAVGGTASLLVDMRDTAGNTVPVPRPTTWTSSNPAVATVAPNLSRGALVTGVSAGIAKISATVEGKSDTAVVAVGPPEQIVRLVLSPNPATLVLQATVQLSALGRDNQGFLNPIDSTRVAWSSSNPSVASVTSTGLVKGLRAGTATINGAWSGYQATATVNVVSLSFATISANGWHACGVTATGAAFCWGLGEEGELGTGKLGEVATPTAVAGGHTFTTVNVGVASTCGLADGGTPYCWGQRLGGTETCLNGPCNTTPVVVPGGHRFTTLSVGARGVGIMHVCALDSAGVAYCWGHNNGGQLGTGDTVSSETPRPVAGGLTFTAVSAGGFHACGLTAAGDAYCWGSNFHRQLGTGDTVPSTMPRRVAGGLTFTALSAAASHTCALDSNGAAYCWGISDYYYPETRGSPTPVPVMSGVRFVAINSTASAVSTCGIDSTGTVRCWMPGGDVYTGAPQWTVPGGLAFTTLSHGYFHSCAVTAQRVGYCWGRNIWGQLGIGSTSEMGADSEFFTATPLKVMGQP